MELDELRMLPTVGPIRDRGLKIALGIYESEVSTSVSSLAF